MTCKHAVARSKWFTPACCMRQFRMVYSIETAICCPRRGIRCHFGLYVLWCWQDRPVSIKHQIISNFEILTWCQIFNIFQFFYIFSKDVQRSTLPATPKSIILRSGADMDVKSSVRMEGSSDRLVAAITCFPFPTSTTWIGAEQLQPHDLFPHFVGRYQRHEAKDHEWRSTG